MDPREESAGKPQLQDRLRLLTDENVQLRDEKEVLLSKVEDLQNKLSQAAGAKTSLSSKLISSEEEKLKISKDLVEVQIKTNKLREQFEEDTFQLKNKILCQENRLTELETERERLQEDIRSTRERLQAAERNHKDLVKEYVTLKSNHLALTQEHEREVLRSEELSTELLALAQAQDTLLRQHESLHRSRGGQGATAPQLDRLLGKQEEMQGDLDRMKKTHEEQQRQLEEKVVAMGKEQQENKKAIHNTQQKLAEQSVALLSSQSQLKELESENSRLQLQVKELNEEYRAQLVSYLHDLAEYVDGSKGSQEKKKAPEWTQMKKFVDSMLQDIRASYRSREEQLASATRAYKKRLQRVIRDHEALLIAYRLMQREQILALNKQGLDPGPPESHFSLRDATLQTELSQEVHRLREDKARLEAQLKEAQGQVKCTNSAGRFFPSHSLLISLALLGNTALGSWGKVTKGGWADIRKELREFTYSTLEALERERVQLITRASVAEGQVAELQEYVDKHLSRYKEEITRLRRLLDAADPAPGSSHHSVETTKL
ncbi:coiled-coil domain-containing protein 78 isoform X1 [Arapaima gigas]